jgi:hypothetical protein
MKISNVIITLSVGITVAAFGYTAYQSTTHIPEAKQELAEQQQLVKEYTTSTFELETEKRPMVTSARTALQSFFASAYTFKNQHEFDGRAQAAEKYATPDAIKNSQLFVADTNKTIEKLHQTGTFDKLLFFPESENKQTLTGKVLVDVSTAQELEPQNIKKGSRREGYQVTYDVNTKQLTTIKPLGTFVVHADSAIINGN